MTTSGQVSLSHGARRHVDDVNHAYLSGELAHEIRELERDIAQRGMRLPYPDERTSSNSNVLDPTGDGWLFESRRRRELLRLHEAVRDAFASAHHEWQEMARLRYLEGLTFAEIGEHLLISSETARTWNRELRLMVATRLGWA